MNKWKPVYDWNDSNTEYLLVGVQPDETSSYSLLLFKKGSNANSIVLSIEGKENESLGELIDILNRTTLATEIALEDLPAQNWIDIKFTSLYTKE